MFPYARRGATHVAGTDLCKRVSRASSPRLRRQLAQPVRPNHREMDSVADAHARQQISIPAISHATPPPTTATTRETYGIVTHAHAHPRKRIRTHHNAVRSVCGCRRFPLAAFDVFAVARIEERSFRPHGREISGQGVWRGREIGHKEVRKVDRQAGL